MPSRRSLITLAVLTALILLPSASFAAVVDVDLAITKDDGAASSTPGTTVIYTITASNPSAFDESGITVTDMFPASLTCTWTCTASAGSSCTAAGVGDINDSITLLAGGTATYTATCNIDPAATGMLSNTATVASTSPMMPDPNMANNSATDVNTLTPIADLDITSMVSPNPADVGTPVTVEVTVTNNGPSDATNAVVTTTLPPGLTFDSSMGCAEDPNGFPTCSLGTIAAGASTMFTLVVTPGAVGGHSMEMNVGSDATDPTPGNDTATAAITAEPAVDPTEIPTLDDLGLLMMMLLLAGAALWGMRRR